jgi:fructokinase
VFDVVALGELLIDFTPFGASPGGMRLFEQNPGGAPANVLCALSNLGLKTAFVGKVGADMHGDFLKSVLQSRKVCTEGLVQDPEVFTTLAFVELSETGERSFSFARKPGADTCLREEELNPGLLRNTRVFHFGSLSLTDEPARSATLAAVRAAKSAGAVVSFDPNYRPPLWKSEDEAKRILKSVLPLADVVKLSEEEAVLLTGEESPEKASEALTGLGIPCVAVTLGKEGALIRTRNVFSRVLAPDCRVVDTTGAGDAFCAGLLCRLVEGGGNPAELTREGAEDILRFANAVASLCVQKRGAIPAMPGREEVERLCRAGR